MANNERARRPYPHAGRFGYLLLSILLLFALNPILSGGPLRITVMQVLFTAIMLASVYAVRGERRLFLIGIALVLPAIIANWLTVGVEIPWLLVAARLLLALFLVLTTSVILYEIATETEVTADTIYGSACVYLLLGLIFAFLFSSFEMVFPGSFHMTLQDLPGAVGDIAYESAIFSELAYFSYVTLTTLGYGDITPLTQMVRWLSTSEAVLGQFYLAVLVARLIGMHLAGLQRRQA